MMMTENMIVRWTCVRRESFTRSLADTTIFSGDINKCIENDDDRDDNDDDDEITQLARALDKV